MVNNIIIYRESFKVYFNGIIYHSITKWYNLLPTLNIIVFDVYYNVDDVMLYQILC